MLRMWKKFRLLVPYVDTVTLSQSGLRNLFLHNGQKILHLLLGKGKEWMVFQKDFIAVAERLQIIAGASADPGSNFQEIFFGMETAYNSCPEFIVQVRIQKQADRVSDIVQERIHVRIVFTAADARIVVRSGFDVHCDIIQQSIFHKILQHSWIGTVGIQLYLIAFLAYHGEKLWQILVQSRFPAGYTDPFQDTGAFFQKVPEFVGINRGGVFVREDEGAILAEGTAEIAAVQEDDRSQAAREIQ